MFSGFSAARTIVLRAIADHVTPGAVIEVGTSEQPLWREALGRLTYDAAAPDTREDTIFDLASLTKVLATTPLIMRHVERGALALEDRVAQHLPGWTGADRESVTLRDLLAHCSGLPAHRPLYEHLEGRAAFERAICGIPLEYAPRTASVYSDLGFMLLGFLLEDISALPRQFDALQFQMGNIQDLQFHPPSTWIGRTAPTQDKDFRGGLVVGAVDDDNAWALGGAAGHAGLFGTAAAVGECARHVLQVLDSRTGAFRRDTLRAFIAPTTDVPGSSRALGWDTMRATSSCGSRMSPRAFGHTGYTGTSLWIDPDRGIYVVLLTNRVHPRAHGDAITGLRRSVHDAVIDAIDQR